MADIKALEKEFDKYYFDMYYDEAMQVVGKMNMASYQRKAAYCEALIYYEQGKYEKVRHMLRNKSKKDLYETELYICSLLELQLYDEYIAERKKMGLVSLSCVAYMGALLIEQGWELDKIAALGALRVEGDSSTYMDRRYRWFVANTIAEIYAVNEEKLQMIEAKMDEEQIDYMKNLLYRKFESIRISDAVKDEIRQTVESDRHFDKGMVLYFAMGYCGNPKIFESRSLDQLYGNSVFTNMYDIIHYLEICRKIDYETVEVEAFLYGTALEDALAKGNMYAINLTKNIYLDVCVYNRFAINEEKDTIADFLLAMIKRHAPYVLNDINNHVMDQKIYLTLSNRGKFAYKAAQWQFDNSMSTDYGTKDAGMLCLSYMRILEAEINERLISKIKGHIEEINRAYREFIEGLTSEQDKHKKKWEFVMSSLNKDKALELGAVYAIFDYARGDKFKKSKPDYGMGNKLRSFIDMYLSEEGKKALLDGSLASMVAPKIRDKYRNPPAHTRYVRLETALECRNYVEENLLKLASYIQ